MASRTYIPTAVLLLNKICTYLSKHRDAIVAVAGSEAGAKINALVTACVDLTDLLVTFIPDGS